MSQQQPRKKKARSAEDDVEEIPVSEASQRALFLKPLFSKRPWYLGGKVAYSTDGATCYSIFQGSLAVVDVETQQIQSLLAEGDDVVGFAQTYGNILSTVSRKGLIRVFESHVAQRQFASLHTQLVSEMCMDGDLLATGGMDAVVKLFSASGGYVTHNLRGHTGHISALAFSKPSKRTQIPKLASADSTGTICVWDLEKKTPNQWFKGTHMSVVPSLAFTEDFLVSVGRDRVFSVWDWHAGKLVKTVPTVNESLEAVLDLPGNDFVIGGAMGALRRFTVESGKVRELANIDLGHGDGVAFIVPCGEASIAVVSHVELLFSYHDVQALERETRGKQCGFDDEILDCCFVGSGKRRTVAICTNSPLLRLYDFADDKSTNVTLLRGHTASVLSVVSNSDNMLVTGSKDNTLRVWKQSHGMSYECTAVLEGHADSVGTLALGVQASVIVSGSDDGSLRLWDQTSYECLDAQVAAHSKAVLDVSFSPTHEELLGSCSADKTAKIWQLVRGSGSSKKFRLVKKCDLIGHRRQVNSIRLSSVDRVCITASSDLTVRVWNVDTGASVRMLEGHTAAVSRALIMRNGHSVISTGADGTIKTWDLKTSTCGQTLFGKKDGGHEQRIWSAAVCTEEDETEYACTVGIEGVLTVWKDAHVEEVERKNLLVKEERDNRDELDRSLRERRFVDAAKLALKLDRPNQLRQILEQDSTVLAALLKQCTNEELALFLNCVLQWNTVGRNCLVAQRCLNACLDLDRVELETKVGGAVLAKFLKAMLPYTERHFNRIDRLLKTSYLVDRVLETTSSLV